MLPSYHPSQVRLLEPKRATSVGIIVNKMERVLQGKPLRDAIMEVDENTLTPTLTRTLT